MVLLISTKLFKNHYFPVCNWMCDIGRVFPPNRKWLGGYVVDLILGGLNVSLCSPKPNFISRIITRGVSPEAVRRLCGGPRRVPGDPLQVRLPRRHLLAHLPRQHLGDHRHHRDLRVLPGHVRQHEGEPLHAHQREYSLVCGVELCLIILKTWACLHIHTNQRCSAKYVCAST